MTAPTVTSANVPNAAPLAPTSPDTGAALSSPMSGTAVPPTAASAQPAAATQAPSPAAPLANQRYPAGEGFPDWMVGRTVAEIATLSSQMAQAVRLPASNQGYVTPNYNTPGNSGYYPTNNANYPPLPYTNAPPVVAPTLPSQDDFITRPAEATRQMMDYYKDRDFAPAMQEQSNMAAQTNRALAELRDPDAFKKWGPEIDLALRQYAPNPSAHTPDNIRAVVDVVRGRHAHEIANEEIERRVQERLNSQLGGTLRPGTGGGTSIAGTNALDFEKLPPGYATVMKRMGMTPDKVDEFLQLTTMRSQPGLSLDAAREQWMAKAMKGDVITDMPHQMEWNAAT